MTLNVSVVGKFHENASDLGDKNDSPLCDMDEDDPNILVSMEPSNKVNMIIIIGRYELWPYSGQCVM